jgi:chromate reductase
MTTVATLVGSLRKDSVNLKVTKAVADLAPNLKFDFVPIGDLPFYNEDVEANPPASWVKFREQVKAADAALFVTPEYNRSLPAALKNAVDVGSRPYGKSVWFGKPAAVISASPGGIGGFSANHHLRYSLNFLGMPTLPHEAFIGNAFGLFDKDGRLSNDSTRDFLTQFGKTFTAWIEKHR